MLVACLTFIATPAGATSANYTSSTTCSPSVANGVCIASVSADYGTSTVSLGMTVGQATDPTKDPNWLDDGFNTEVIWGISVNGASTATYFAEADSNFNTPGTFSGVVFSASSFDTLCDDSTGVTVTFSVSTDQYGLTFPASCIQAPSSLGVQANWEYATTVDSIGVIATAPGTTDTFTPCCTVTPDATTTSSSTTTTTSTTSTSATSTTTSTSTPTTKGATSTTSSTTAPTSSSTSSSTSTTTSTTAAVLTSGASSTGNSGSGSSGLAVTGTGEAIPVLVVAGVGLLTIGMLGRRRVVRLARRNGHRPLP